MSVEQNQKIVDATPAQYRKAMQVFADMCAIPHESTNSKPITEHFRQYAEKQGFKVVVDEFNNLVISVPATPGLENVPGICMQAHTDMVAVKAPESNHVFGKDPLQLHVEDGWLYANKTTLGADDGMGVAIAFAVAEDKNIKHGPIEILLTSDEEIGLIGASGLKTCLKSKYLLNLDSEELGEICVSCAGGFRVTFDKEFVMQQVPEGYHAFTIKISGYLGGHSGVEINQYRASAIKQMARLLKNIPADFRICNISGGQAHNAIPAICEVQIVASCCGSSGEKLQELFSKIHEPFAAKEKNAKVEMIPSDAKECFSKEDTDNIINLLLNAPHGPIRFSQEVKDFVETSFTTATIETIGNKIHILGSGRSCYEQEIDFLHQQCVALAQMAGWKASEQLNRYPGWPAKMESQLIKIVERVYKQHSDHVKVTAIHAGLEAGMVCKLHEGMEAVSIGPTIVSPHSPKERCLIDSVYKIYDIVKDILQDIAK